MSLEREHSWQRNIPACFPLGIEPKTQVCAQPGTWANARPPSHKGRASCIFIRVLTQSHGAGPSEFGVKWAHSLNSAFVAVPVVHAASLPVNTSHVSLSVHVLVGVGREDRK